jgi:hypothetical protein
MLAFLAENAFPGFPPGPDPKVYDVSSLPRYFHTQCSFH